MIYERITTDAALTREDAVGEGRAAFSGVLATDGEASDGHILSMAGGEVPDRMPLLFGHASDPVLPALGSVIAPALSEHELRVTASINTAGDDPLAGVRRGVARLVEDGDLSALSLRWQGIEQQPRASLPSDHPAAPGPETSEEGRRWGLYFSRWRAQEGSIVAIGADPQAMLGRADSETDEAARCFYRILARSAAAEGGTADIAGVLDALVSVRDAVAAAIERGATPTDIATFVGDEGGALDPREVVAYDFGSAEAPARALIPRAAWDSLRGESIESYREAVRLATARRDSPPPPAAAVPASRTDNAEIARALREAVTIDAETISRLAYEAVRRALGKVG